MKFILGTLLKTKKSNCNFCEENKECIAKAVICRGDHYAPFTKNNLVRVIDGEVEFAFPLFRPDYYKISGYTFEVLRKRLDEPQYINFYICKDCIKELAKIV